MASPRLEQGVQESRDVDGCVPGEQTVHACPVAEKYSAPTVAQLTQD